MRTNPITQPQTLRAVTIPCAQRGQETAFLLGYRHGIEGLRPRKAETFIVPATRTAYSLGYVAGRAARALAKGALNSASTAPNAASHFILSV